MGLFPRERLGHQRSGDLAEGESWVIRPVLRTPSPCLLTSLGSHLAPSVARGLESRAGFVELL